ncbi:MULTISPECIES: hypothetical protein [Serratia]|uniref:hypothetical protein n=1 Tax=Serratia TaxID=613 RepID=UPI00235DF557|nr:MULTISPECIES: hypothetical protein [Serratia]
MIFTLAGCADAISPPPEQKSPTTQQVRAEQEAQRLTQCRKELEVLKGIDAAQYRTYTQAFDRLMQGAAQYAGLRPDVSPQTQETVDALYRYRVNRLCADITQSTLTGLTARGETVK